MSARRAILVVSPYRAEYGPPQTLEHVCRAVVRAGFDPVCVVPVEAHITVGLRELEPRVHVVRQLSTFPRTLNVFRLAAFFSRHLRASHRIKAIATAEGVAAVFSISEATFAGSLAARRLDIPSIVHVIGMSIRSPAWIGAPYVRFLDRLTDRFVACSSAVSEMLDGYGVDEGRITVVHNGVDAAAIDGTARDGNPIDAGQAVGIVAAYDPRKGHELFVEAAAIIALEHPQARFYIVGGTLDGHPESRTFEARVATMIAERGLADRFVRTGFVPAPAVYGWIRSLDVAVVPSRTEAFAHALLEAMVCRRAVVATGIEGNLDAFVHDHSGLYVDPTPAAVAEGVSALLRDPERRAALGDAAHDRASTYFDLDVTIRGLADAIAVTVASGVESVEGREVGGVETQLLGT